ncbi:hypothetical protein OHA71_23575 [Streptomyces sp. NBC_00444]|uniref:hypothetical protein n=1 Tax=Streptomyces sp. NBC_00444 TaxID=2975744 RepID=UPI002E1FBECD
MRTRVETIAVLLRQPQPVRQPLAYELRGSVVQLLGPGTTAPTWQATPEVLAEAIDTALQKDTRRSSQLWAGDATARAEILAVLEDAGYNTAAAADLLGRAFREPHTDPPDTEFPESLAGGHALIVEYGDCETHGSCQCGRRLGRTTQGVRLDALAVPWTRHVCTDLPALARPNGAS